MISRNNVVMIVVYLPTMFKLFNSECAWCGDDDDWWGEVSFEGLRVREKQAVTCIVNKII